MRAAVARFAFVSFSAYNSREDAFATGPLIMSRTDLQTDALIRSIRRMLGTTSPPSSTSIEIPNVAPMPQFSTPSPTATFTLTNGLVKGDRDAFDAFYERYFDFLFHEAKQASRGDESVCLDIVQDVMMRVIKSLRMPMQSEEQVRAYLRRIVLSVTIDRWRMEQRRRAPQTRAANPHAARSAESSAQYAKIGEAPETDERILWLHRELQNLDDLQSSMMIMRYRFNWTLGRIGEAIGLSASAVDGRINRILNRLRKIGQEIFDDE